jgi:ribosomal protein L6P/L9E
MSRIGRKPIPVPAGVKIALQASQVDVQGPKGKLTVPLPHGITFEQKDGVLCAPPKTTARCTGWLALWWPTRSRASP